MKKIAVIGGGIAGATLAQTIVEQGWSVTIIEKNTSLGGNVKDFGCKATDICQKCNLCLIDKTFLAVQQHPQIKISFGSKVVDLKGQKGNFQLTLEKNNTIEEQKDFDFLVIATGYQKYSELEQGTLEFKANKRVIWASEFEEMLLQRKDHSLEQESFWDKPIIKAAFLYCNGSRSITEKAPFCSRICCGYNYRMGKVLRHFYPEIELTAFYMDFQQAGFFENIDITKMKEAGFKTINCRPIHVKEAEDALVIEYEEQHLKKRKTYRGDLLVLSEGMHSQNQRPDLSSLFNLQSNEYGFLQSLWPDYQSGVFLTGCVKGPKDIANTIADAKNTAYSILQCDEGRLI